MAGLQELLDLRSDDGILFGAEVSLPLLHRSSVRSDVELVLRYTWRNSGQLMRRPDEDITVFLEAFDHFLFLVGLQIGRNEGRDLRSGRVNLHFLFFFINQRGRFFSLAFTSTRGVFQVELASARTIST